MVVSTSSRSFSSSSTGGLPPVTWDPPTTFTLEGRGGGALTIGVFRDLHNKIFHVSKARN